MKEWLNTLSNKEIRVWIKNMSSPFSLFLATDQDLNNLKIAKQILKERVK
tara:strand:+ start:164 stop:313 length:150 start_codon:yes stop_codon:yes gene_type:complete